MINVNTILKKLTPYKGEEVVINGNQSTNDIINGLLNTHKKYLTEYDKICKYFYANNVEDICKNIFEFLKKNVPYEIENSKKQYLRSPSAILEHSKGADCKSYSLFTNGILDAIKRNYGLNFDVVYRFAGYNNNNNLEHVFSVVKSNYGELWNDPVLNYFNSREKSPTFTLDKKIKPMALVGISGIPKQNLNYQQKSILQQLTPQPSYVYYGVANENTAMGNCGCGYKKMGNIEEDIDNGDWAKVWSYITNIFNYVSDGEKRKAAFDQSGKSVDAIASYYIDNRNNFGQKNDWQLNEFSELYSNKAPQQGKGWTNRNSEISLATAKRFNEIVSKYLTRSDAAEWQKILISLNEVNQTLPPTPPASGAAPTAAAGGSLLPIGLGILLLKTLM
jgi:hypothetical protein